MATPDKQSQADALLSEAMAITLMPLEIMAQKYNTDPTEKDRNAISEDIMRDYHQLMREIKEDEQEDEQEDEADDSFGLDPAFSSWEEVNGMFFRR